MNNSTNRYVDKILELEIKEANTKEFMKSFMHYPIETIRILESQTREIEELNSRYYEFRSKYK